MSSVTLKKFDPSRLKNRHSLIIGRRSTGKTTLIKDLLYHNQDIPCGTVCTPTYSDNDFYSKFIPEMFVNTKVKPSGVVKKLIDRQGHVIRCIRENGSKIDPKAFCVLDDAFHDTKQFKDNSIKNLFFNGTNYRITSFMSMSYLFGISPALRSNVDYIFVLRETSSQNLKKIYEYYGGITTFSKFKDLVRQCTQNYGCLVIDNTSYSNKLEECLYWYKANNKLPEFKMMDEVFRQYQPQQTSEKEKETKTDDIVDIMDDEVKEKIMELKQLNQKIVDDNNKFKETIADFKAKLKQLNKNSQKFDNDFKEQIKYLNKD